ncbi:hypothetical protein [Streptomyces sp. NPDC015350]|uniref:hypothetical protein n=1 Tax=Streptomyces sp. NPDC015350 TaxID=3364955 RepID=UPI0036FCD12C
MTVVEVVDETGTHQTLRHQVDRLLAQVAPLVHPATGLALPERVVFRIVSPRTWQIQHRDMLRREFGQLGAQQPLRTLVPAVRKQAGARVSFRRHGTLLGEVTAAETLRRPRLRSETLLIPEGLEHIGVSFSEGHLIRVLAHEAVHQAQNLASKHRFSWTRCRSSGTGEAVAVVEEGHARWADRQITRQLLGAPVDPDTAPRSGHYLHVLRNEGIARLHTVLRARQETGCRLVEEAVRAVGTGRLNAVWTERLLLPTPQERNDPPLWGARLGRL